MIAMRAAPAAAHFAAETHGAQREKEKVVCEEHPKISKKRWAAGLEIVCDFMSRIRNHLSPQLVTKKRVTLSGFICNNWQVN